MSYRVILQVVVTGSQVVSKAFVEAFKQARSANLSAAQDAASAAKAGGLSLSEARKILGIEDGKLDRDTAQKKYNYLFDANSKEKSGSFYLQSKVYRAMERVKLEWGEEHKAESGKAEVKDPKSDEKPPKSQ